MRLGTAAGRNPLLGQQLRAEEEDEGGVHGGLGCARGDLCGSAIVGAAGSDEAQETDDGALLFRCSPDADGQPQRSATATSHDAPATAAATSRGASTARIGAEQTSGHSSECRPPTRRDQDRSPWSADSRTLATAVKTPRPATQHGARTLPAPVRGRPARAPEAYVDVNCLTRRAADPPRRRHRLWRDHGAVDARPPPALQAPGHA